MSRNDGIYNVNNISTGSTALILAKALIESGKAHCVPGLRLRRDGARVS
jgi:hypothetical protein